MRAGLMPSIIIIIMIILTISMDAHDVFKRTQKGHMDVYPFPSFKPQLNQHNP